MSVGYTTLPQLKCQTANDCKNDVNKPLPASTTNNLSTDPGNHRSKLANSSKTFATFKHGQMDSSESFIKSYCIELSKNINISNSSSEAGNFVLLTEALCYRPNCLH